MIIFIQLVWPENFCLGEKSLLVAILFIAYLSLLMDSLDRVKQLDLFLSFLIFTCLKTVMFYSGKNICAHIKLVIYLSRQTTMTNSGQVRASVTSCKGVKVKIHMQ